MSGGSYNYACYKVKDMASELSLDTPLRKAFKRHLEKVADAMHDIEWVDSGDCSPGTEDEAIMACLGKNAVSLVMAELIEELQKAIITAQLYIDKYKV